MNAQTSDQQHQPLDLRKTAEQSDIGVPGIGRHKYNLLKSLPKEKLTEEQIGQIEQFENRNAMSEHSAQLTKAYSERIMGRKPNVEFSISARRLWDLFRERFEIVNGIPFEKNDTTLANIMPLIYYFSKDQRFFSCTNLSGISEPSFDKGILIVGTFGNGKTAVMKTFESLFKGIPDVSFKGYSANDVVQMYETSGDDPETCRMTKAQFDTAINKGNRYFDDLKTERVASNYGKVNLFKDIIETRYDRMVDNVTGARRFTFGSCNYKPGFDGDVSAALDEFGEKYGGRVYDRLFQMFNIVEFHGKSFRK